MADAVRTPDGKISVLDKSGTAFKIPEESLSQAFQSGMRLETADEWNKRTKHVERSSLGEQAKTAAEGAVRGATFGLGTKALTELGGEEYRQAAQERAEENPTTALVSEIGGAVIPSLLSGGAGAAGAAARLTPAAIAARAGLAAERGAAALAGRTALPGALRAAVSTGTGAAVEGGLYGLGSSLADSALEGTDWTAERALAGLEDGALYGLAGGALLGAGGHALKGGTKAARAAVEGMSEGGVSFKQAVQNWAEGKLGLGAKADDADRLLAKLTDDGADASRIDRIRARIAEAGIDGTSRAEVAALAKTEAEAAIARKAQATLELGQAGVRADPGELRGHLEDVAERLRAAGTSDHVAAARRLETLAKRDASTLPRQVALQSEVNDVVSWARESGRAALPDVEKAAKTLGAQIDDAVIGGAPDTAPLWSVARQEADDWASVAGALDKAPAATAGGEPNKMLGMLGMAASVATGSPIPTFIASAMNSPGLQQMARKFVNERGGAGLSWLAERAGGVERLINSTAQAIADGSALKTGGGLSRAAKKASFLGAREAVHAFQANPRQLQQNIERTIAPIAREQPEVAIAMTQRIVEDYAWLSSKLPAPMTRADTSLTPVKEEERLPAREEIRFANYAEALASPMSVFDSIASGHVNWDGIEALKERRPDLWNSMRTRVIMTLNQAEKPPQFRKRVLLGLAFDFPSDWSMGNVASIQATFAQPPDTGNGKPAMAGVSTDMMALPGEQGVPAT